MDNTLLAQMLYLKYSRDDMLIWLKEIQELERFGKKPISLINALNRPGTMSNLRDAYLKTWPKLSEWL